MQEVRPLGKLSNFVVEELPLLLQKNSKDIPSKVENLLTGMSQQDLWTAFSLDREIALLDLKFCEVSMIRTELPVPKILSDTVDFFCDGKNIPGLQYHELIELNPARDMRLFTWNEFRETERIFYEAHRSMENIFKRIIVSLENLLASPADPHSCLRNPEIVFDYNFAGTLMQNLHNMPEGHFEVFRHFIKKPCPIRNVDGPSGSYSWRMPYIEILVWGDQLPLQYQNDILEKLQYYSMEGRENLQSKLSKIDGFVSVVSKASDPRYRLLVKKSIDFMKPFRNMHLAAVAKQIPEVFHDKEEGTSGNKQAGSYLKKRHKDMKSLYDAFLEEYKEK